MRFHFDWLRMQEMHWIRFSRQLLLLLLFIGNRESLLEKGKTFTFPHLMIGGERLNTFNIKKRAGETTWRERERYGGGPHSLFTFRVRWMGRPYPAFSSSQTAFLNRLHVIKKMVLQKVWIYQDSQLLWYIFLLFPSSIRTKIPGSLLYIWCTVLLVLLLRSSMWGDGIVPYPFYTGFFHSRKWILFFLPLRIDSNSIIITLP